MNALAQYKKAYSYKLQKSGDYAKRQNVISNRPRILQATIIKKVYMIISYYMII